MKTNLGEPYKFVVPWESQQWMMEALGDIMFAKLHDLLHDYWPTIHELATNRHAEGYTHFGSEMYNWEPNERLENVLEELADAIVYLTSGPTEEKRNGCEEKCTD